MVNIVTQKHNFEEMLSNDITDNMIVLMTDLLSRICGSNFDTMKMSIIQMALSSHFTDHLTKFISGIAIKVSIYSSCMSFRLFSLFNILTAMIIFTKSEPGYKSKKIHLNYIDDA